MGLKYGGKVKDNYLAMRGPCQEGFHIPTKNELSDLLNIMKNRGLGDLANFTRYLKMPNRGCRGYNDGSVRYQGSISLYWTCTSNMYGGNPSSPSSANSLLCGPDEVKTMSHNISYGFSIRPFKNEIVIPDSNRTVLYQGTGNSGIFHNNSLGLISISDDGINRKTISDKNLGATTVRNYGDTGTDANCGYLYQWGNNYGFPFSGSVTTGTTQVDITQYGPGNYYSSSTFILASSVGHGWNSTINKNLRGGQARLPFDIKERQYGGKRKNKYTSMRGPCPEGFHIPTNSEMNIFVDYIRLMTGSFLHDYLNIPYAGYIDGYTGTSEQTGTTISLWTCTRHDNITAYLYSISDDSQESSTRRTNASDACPIRPFADEYVEPIGSDWEEVRWAFTHTAYKNANLGLISIPDIGITMADKNVGATNVGDNGYYFQWGNNYGFIPGQLTTSTTRVDASTYGPGNYYSSDTFITGSGDWSSVRNDNLRGGVTGIQKIPVKVKKVYYGGKLVDSYSAMQGPAPAGFHVPLNTERQAVYDVWTALGGGSSDGTNFGIALKLPKAGYRYATSADATVQGSHGLYWSSSPSPSNANYSYYLDFGSSNVSPQLSYYRANGFSVRCFKNSSTVPTSSWTKLYGTSIKSGGIFWSNTDGLISLSSDGNTWITISDKNLGATTAWNSGDTLSEANCGKYYQWGNNYAFPRTGTIANQSTTRVDASTYGPGNYYSSDTFIKYNGRWDSTDNGNLWGGVTGIQQRPILIREDNS